MQRLFSMFYKKSPVFYIVITLTGLLNSVLNSAFMILVGRSITNPDFLASGQRYFLLFILLFSACIILNITFYRYLARLSSTLVSEVEMDIIQKIRSASFRQFNRIGNEEVYAAIRNIKILGEAPGNFIRILVAFLTVLGCVVYLFFVSYIYGIIIAIMIGLTLYSYFLRSRMFKNEYKKLRDLQIEYYGHLGDLLLGFKDLKMSSVKSDSIYSKFILENRKTLKQVEMKFKTKLLMNNFLTNYAWYFCLGVVILVLPKWGQIGLYNPSVFALILVYILGPLSMITDFIPFLAELRQVADNIGSINEKLSKEAGEAYIEERKADLREFSSLQFRQVYFEHVDEHHGKTFALGPIDLEFKEGDLIFLIGGNGSGKSTFLNILTGLQKPLSGHILYNNELIRDEHYVAYRDKIAAIFSDGYLLRNNYEEFQVSLKNARVSEYIRLMKLDDVMSDDDIYGYKDRLSKGQQKRFLMILSLLMGKKILVWDEWEAEQDPGFKDYFYKCVIPYLRKEGRTIISITHNDQYLAHADKVIKFKDGLIVQ